MKLGVSTFGLAMFVTGAIDVIWGRFDPAEQPIQAFEDHVPGAHVFAYVVGIALIVAAILILRRRTARAGAAIAIAAYALFAVFNFPRFSTAPHYLGQHVWVYLSVMTGVCQNVIVMCAAAILFLLSSGAPEPKRAVAIRWTFGLSVIVFGCNHLASIAGGAPYVPAWMPFGASFWVAFTGVAFVLAGIAIVIRVADVPAARALATMLLVFSAVTLVPLLVAAPTMEANWGANAYNIVAAASAWIFADWSAGRLEW